MEPQQEEILELDDQQRFAKLIVDHEQYYQKENVIVAVLKEDMDFIGTAIHLLQLIYKTNNRDLVDYVDQKSVISLTEAQILYKLLVVSTDADDYFLALGAILQKAEKSGLKPEEVVCEIK